jgi:hypothetical protein
MSTEAGFDSISARQTILSLSWDLFGDTVSSVVGIDLVAFVALAFSVVQFTLSAAFFHLGLASCFSIYGFTGFGSSAGFDRKRTLNAVVGDVFVALEFRTLAALAFVETHRRFLTRFNTFEVLLSAVLSCVKVVDVAITHSVLVTKLPSVFRSFADEFVLSVRVGRCAGEVAEQQSTENKPQHKLSLMFHDKLRVHENHRNTRLSTMSEIVLNSISVLGSIFEAVISFLVCAPDEADLRCAA